MQRIWKRRRGAALLAIAILLLLAGCTVGGQSRLPKVGQTAPDLTVQQLDGGEVSLVDLRGKVVLLNFWATYCPPCKDEMPDMEAVYREVQDKGGIVLAVDQREGADTVRRFVQEYGLTFPVALDEKGTAGGAYGVQYLPTTFVIDRNGIVRYMTVGQIDKETIRRYFTTLL